VSSSGEIPFFLITISMLTAPKTKTVLTLLFDFAKEGSVVCAYVMSAVEEFPNPKNVTSIRFCPVEIKVKVRMGRRPIFDCHLSLL